MTWVYCLRNVGPNCYRDNTYRPRQEAPTGDVAFDNLQTIMLQVDTKQPLLGSDGRTAKKCPWAVSQCRLRTIILGIMLMLEQSLHIDDERLPVLTFQRTQISVIT